MMVGYPPFFSENPSDTCQKIIQWKKHFSIPIESNLSLEADNLIRKLVCPAESRLGINGADEIKSHPFFKGFDWSNVGKMKAPFLPNLQNDCDVKYFDTFPEQDPFYPTDKKNKKKGRKDVAFMDYTYNDEIEKQKGGFIHALEILEAVKVTLNKDDEKCKIITNEMNDEEKIIFEKPHSNSQKETYSTKLDSEKIQEEGKKGVPLGKQLSGKNLVTTQSKGMNMISLKNTGSKDNALFSSSLSPKSKDTPTQGNQSTQKLPQTTKNTETKITFDNKYISKIKTNGVTTTSTSPKNEAIGKAGLDKTKSKFI